MTRIMQRVGEYFNAGRVELGVGVAQSYRTLLIAGIASSNRVTIAGRLRRVRCRTAIRNRASSLFPPLSMRGTPLVRKCPRRLRLVGYSSRIIKPPRTMRVQVRGFIITAFRSLSLSAWLALALTTCSGGSKPPSDRDSDASAASGASLDSEKVLNVYNWSDYI